ncbi:MAG: hypothetical protein Q9160_001967 [Pyrenula sp. 1 TL-2023]
MALVLDIAKDEDFEKMMDVVFGAIDGTDEFVKAVYPLNMNKEGRDKHRQKFLYIKSIDPSQRWLKVTDTASNEIIGVANWQVYDKKKPPETTLDGPEGTWSNQNEKEWAQAIFDAYMEDRRRVIRAATGPVMCLSLLAVKTERQFREAGAMLIRWGTDLANRLNAVGFSLKRHYTLAVPDKFPDRKTEIFFYTYRPRKPRKENA